MADANDEEEGESEPEEDIFELEGQTENLHLSDSAERLQGRGGWEGAAGGDPSCTNPTTSACGLCHKEHDDAHPVLSLCVTAS